MTLFDTLMFLISKGKTEGLSIKIEKLYNGNKLTQDEYETLTESLTPTDDEVEE